MEFDGWISTALFETWDLISRYYSAYSAFLLRFRITGIRRLFVDIMDDMATFGLIFALGLITLALPPFSGTGDAWNKGRDYAVTLTDVNGEIL